MYIYNSNNHNNNNDDNKMSTSATIILIRSELFMVRVTRLRLAIVRRRDAHSALA